MWKKSKRHQKPIKVTMTLAFTLNEKGTTYSSLFEQKIKKLEVYSKTDFTLKTD